MNKILYIIFAHILKLLYGLVSIKLLALYLKPELFAQIGNLITFVLFLTIFSGGGILNGIIKYTAEYSKNNKELLKIISTAFAYSSFISLLLLLFMFMFSQELSLFLLDSPKYWWVILLFTIGSFLFSLSNIITGTITGLKENKIFFIIQLYSINTSLVASYYLISSKIYTLSLISVGLLLLFTIFPSMYFFLKSPFYTKVKLIHIEKKYIVGFSFFSIMSFTTVATLPVSEILIRNLLIENLGLFTTGIWQGSMKLALGYVSLFGVLLTYYLLPTLSSLNDNNKIKVLFIKAFILFTLVYTFGTFFLLTYPGFFIEILLSKEFLEIQNIIFYQVAGDYFKILSYAISYYFIAKTLWKYIIFFEIFQYSLLYAITYYYTISHQNITGVFIAYVITYIIYFLVSLFFIVKILSVKKPIKDILKIKKVI